MSGDKMSDSYYEVTEEDIERGQMALIWAWGETMGGTTRRDLAKRVLDEVLPRRLRSWLQWMDKYITEAQEAEQRAVVRADSAEAHVRELEVQLVIARSDLSEMLDMQRSQRSDERHLIEKVSAAMDDYFNRLHLIDEGGQWAGGG